MKIFKKTEDGLRTRGERVSFYVFCAICSIAIFALITWAVVRQTEFYPKVLTEFVDRKLKFLNPSTFKIKNSGTDFRIYLYGCNIFGVQVPEISVKVDLMNFFLRDRNRIKQLKVEIDEAQFEKNGGGIFILTRENSTYDKRVRLDTFFKICDAYSIDDVKIQLRRVQLNNNGGILNFRDVKINCGEKISFKALLKISARVESEIKCNFGLRNDASNFDIKIKKIPFRLIKTVANLHDKLNFLGDSISDCEFSGKIIDAKNLSANFSVRLRDDFVKICNSKIYYNSLKIDGKYDSGILNIDKFLLKSKDSYFAVDNVKVSDEGIFFNSRVNFSGINHDVISDFWHNLRLKNNILEFLKIKNGEVELVGLLSCKLRKAPYIKSGKIIFFNSKVLLTQDFILDDLTGNMLINADNLYKINCSCGRLNKINTLEKVTLSGEKKCVKVRMSGVFDAKYISHFVTEKDLGNSLNFNRMTGILTGDLAFDIPFDRKKTYNHKFNGKANLSYNANNSKVNNSIDTTFDISCEMQTGQGNFSTTGRIVDANRNVINFNFEKTDDHTTKMTYTGSCAAHLPNMLCGAYLFNGNVDIISATIEKNFNNIYSKFVLNVKESEIGIPEILCLKKNGENGLLNVECNYRLKKGDAVDGESSQKICDKTVSFSLNAETAEISGKLGFDEADLTDFSMHVSGENQYILSGQLKNNIWDLELSGATFSLANCNIFPHASNFDLAIDVSDFRCPHLDASPFSLSGFWKKRGAFVKAADMSVTMRNGGKLGVTAVSDDELSEIKLHASNVQTIFRLLGIVGCNAIGNATVRMVQNKRAHKFSGEFSIENCIVKNNETLRNIITLVDRNNHESRNIVGFMNCSGDFEIDENFEKLLIKNCLANGPLLNISTIGRINLTEKTLDVHGDFDINSDEKTKNKKKYKIYGPIENPLFNVM